MKRQDALVDFVGVLHYTLSSAFCAYPACHLTPTAAARIALHRDGVERSRIVTCLRCVQLVD